MKEVVRRKELLSLLGAGVGAGAVVTIEWEDELISEGSSLMTNFEATYWE